MKEETSKAQNGIVANLFSQVPVFSVEFFPPKTEEGARQILKAASSLMEISPDYVSITYGAGGSTRGRTLEYGKILKDKFRFDVMPHLTCCGHSKDEIFSILQNFKEDGFKNIMALRGDPPKGEAKFTPHPDGFKYASELIEFIRANFPEMCLACAGYPEKHPEAPSMEVDIENLKRKIDSGADFIVTQMFFNNDHFFAFRDKCRKAGIEKPISAGILPALSLKQLENFKVMSSSEIPTELVSKMHSASCEDDALKIGEDWARGQIEGLLEGGVDGIHLYILNRANSALNLSRAFGENRR